MKVPLSTSPTITYRGPTRAIDLTEQECLIVLAALRVYTRGHATISDEEAAAARGVASYFNGLFP